MQIDMKRFHAAFFDESAEHLAVMEESLLGLERNPDDGDLLHGIFRAAHSIKGASGTFGFGDIATFTHSLEGLLDRMRGGEITATPDLVQLLLRSADALSGLLSAAKDGDPPPASIDELLAALDAARNGRHSNAAANAPVAAAAPPSAATESREYAVTFLPGRDVLHFGIDPFLVIRELAGLGEIVELRLDASKLPDLVTLDPESCYLGWTIRLQTLKSAEEIRSVFLFVEDCSQIAVEPTASGRDTGIEPQNRAEASAGSDRDAGRSPPAASSPARTRGLEASSIRVSVEKVDELINLVGELVIAQSMVNQVIGRIPPDILPAVQEAVGIMDRSTRDLQERVMSVRMVPLASVFRRFPRVVHDLAGALGKRIVVEIIGEDTELDKQMIEQIVDPLTHLIRNAVDHGIGTPEDRQQSGKPPEGKIALRAYHEGGNVVIEVADDGRGLDRERIRRKAVAQGLIGPDEQLPDERIHALVFAPGFSTADKVTDVSGRGVGMDVVKRNIEALNGSVSIESVPGRGTTFRLRLPLTMAILDGLAVSLNDDIYILPLLSVVESLRPKPQEFKTLVGRGEVILVRGRPVPLVRLHRVFNAPARVTDPTQGLVVITEHLGKEFALLVDDLVEHMQVVMKSLEANYQKVEGVSAATILGDGHVAFILDVAGLSRLAHS